MCIFNSLQDVCRKVCRRFVNFGSTLDQLCTSLGAFSSRILTHIKGRSECKRINWTDTRVTSKESRKMLPRVYGLYSVVLLRKGWFYVYCVSKMDKPESYK